MKQKESKNPVLIRLMDDVLARIPETDSGTYNRQDPTYYSKGKKDFTMDGARFRISYWNCTWGVEIEIFILLPKYPSHQKEFRESREFFTKEVKISDFYTTWGGMQDEPIVIIRHRQKGIYKLLYKFVRTYWPIRVEEDENEIWMDPAGGVHHGYVGDPARMYE